MVRPINVGMEGYGGYEMIQSPRVVKTQQRLELWHSLDHESNSTRCKLNASPRHDIESQIDDAADSANEKIVFDFKETQTSHSMPDPSSMSSAVNKKAKITTRPLFSDLEYRTPRHLSDDSSDANEFGVEDEVFAESVQSYDKQMYISSFSNNADKSSPSMIQGWPLGESIKDQNSPIPPHAESADSTPDSLTQCDPSKTYQKDLEADHTPSCPDVASHTYTKRFLSAFHQWKHNVGSTLCAYVHNVKNWTGLVGEEFALHELDSYDAEVYLLGKKFSFTDESSMSFPLKSNDSIHIEDNIKASQPPHNVLSNFNTTAETSCKNAKDDTFCEATKLTEMQKVNQAQKRLGRSLDSLTFMSYRRDFPPMYRCEQPFNSLYRDAVTSMSIKDINKSKNFDVIKITSDAGWGCTIRCTQMLLCEALKRHFTEYHCPNLSNVIRHPRFPLNEPPLCGAKAFSSEWKRHGSSANACGEEKRSQKYPNHQIVSTKSSFTDQRPDYSREECRSHGGTRVQQNSSRIKGCRLKRFQSSPTLRIYSSANEFRRLERDVLKWFLDIPSPPEVHPFSIFAFVRSAGGGLGWARSLYGLMDLENCLYSAFHKAKCNGSSRTGFKFASLNKKRERYGHSRSLTDLNNEMTNPSIKREETARKYCCATNCYESTSSLRSSLSFPTSKSFSVGQKCNCVEPMNDFPACNSFMKNNELRNSQSTDSSLTSKFIPKRHKNSDEGAGAWCMTARPHSTSLEKVDDPHIFFGKRPGDWFGPATASFTMKYLVESAFVTQDTLAVYVNADGVLDLPNIQNLIQRKKISNEKYRRRRNETRRMFPQRMEQLHGEVSTQTIGREEAEIRELCLSGEIRNINQHRIPLSLPNVRSESEDWQVVQESSPSNIRRFTSNRSPNTLPNSNGRSQLNSAEAYQIYSPLDAFTQFSQGRNFSVPSSLSSSNKCLPSSNMNDASIFSCTDDKAVLLCFPLTLGGARCLNSIYHSSLCRYFELPWFVGLVGGKAGKQQAFYFVGKYMTRTQDSLAETTSQFPEGRIVSRRASRRPWTTNRRSSSCDETSSSPRLTSRKVEKIKRCSSSRRKSISKPRHNFKRYHSSERQITNNSESCDITDRMTAHRVNLLYLDPHVVQASASDVSTDWDSFHGPKVFKTTIKSLDPGFLISFYCPNYKAVEELAISVHLIGSSDKNAPLSVKGANFSSYMNSNSQTVTNDSAGSLINQRESSFAVAKLQKGDFPPAGHPLNRYSKHPNGLQEAIPVKKVSTFENAHSMSLDTPRTKLADIATANTQCEATDWKLTMEQQLVPSSRPQPLFEERVRKLDHNESEAIQKWRPVPLSTQMDETYTSARYRRRLHAKQFHPGTIMSMPTRSRSPLVSMRACDAAILKSSPLETGFQSSFPAHRQYYQDWWPAYTSFKDIPISRLNESHNSDGFVEVSAGDSPRSDFLLLTPINPSQQDPKGYCHHDEKPVRSAHESPPPVNLNVEEGNENIHLPSPMTSVDSVSGAASPSLSFLIINHPEDFMPPWKSPNGSDTLTSTTCSKATTII